MSKAKPAASKGAAPKREPSAAPRLDITELFARAVQLGEAKEAAEVDALYRQWCSGNGGHPLLYAALFNWGCALMSAGDNAGAERAFRQAVAGKPDFLQGVFNLGVVLEKLGRFNEALATWAQLTALPNQAAGESRTVLLLGLNNSGRLLNRLRRYDAAGQLLERSLRLEPEQQDVRHDLAVLRQKEGAWPLRHGAADQTASSGLASGGMATGQRPVIGIVSATRLSEQDFWRTSALGISLRRIEHDSRLRARIAFENRRGLPDVYNDQLASAQSEDILVFIHDDVWIDDYYLADRVLEGLRAYDALGVAGNRRRAENQAGWAFINPTTWDDLANLSGAVAHGEAPFGLVTYFGPAPADCELLDGVFLAVNKPALRAAGVTFDPFFDFHYYDLDFCRSARKHGLRLGTWPICLTHKSKGAFGEKWLEKHKAYLRKWGG